MIIIYANKNIKEQFEKEGLSYPYKKSAKRWGIRGSTALDDVSLELAEKNILRYLSDNGFIFIKEK